MTPLDQLIDAASVIPVMTLDDTSKAAPLAAALKAGGLSVIEMTLRSPNALSVLQAMKAAEPELIIGMGTIRTPDQIAASVDAGADFLVSPGLTDAIAAPLRAIPIPVLPGVATASEAMRAAEQGFELLKFFPAEPAGGTAYLKALQGPLPDIRFCPTGSISRERAPDYLALDNVVCVGGSWIVNTKLIEAQDWDGIEANARAAQAMKR